MKDGFDLGDVIEHLGICIEVNDDGTCDLQVPTYAGDQIIDSIKGVFPLNGPFSTPRIGERVVVEERHPSHNPSDALRWVGTDLETPKLLDADRVVITSKNKTMAIIFDDDALGDESNHPHLYIGALSNTQPAVLGHTLIAKLDELHELLKPWNNSLGLQMSVEGVALMSALSAWVTLVAAASAGVAANPGTPASLLALTTAITNYTTQLTTRGTDAIALETAMDALRETYKAFNSYFVKIAGAEPTVIEEADGYDFSGHS